MQYCQPTNNTKYLVYLSFHAAAGAVMSSFSKQNAIHGHHVGFVFDPCDTLYCISHAFGA